MINNAETIQKFMSSVALISPQHVREISGLAHSPQRCAEQTQETMQQCAANYGFERDSGKPFLFAGGVAVIPVWGALLHRDRWCSSWATGYDFIAAQLAAALGDPDVKGIWWDINSYGGHVAGNFELCEVIREARDKKPMMGYIDSRCFSGGYSIGSAIGRLVSAPSGEAGSIGVVLMHASYEKMMEQAGIEVTFIYAGKHKVDGNPYQDLPSSVKKTLQASIDRSYEKFVSLVASNRNMDPEKVRETEAGIFDAEIAKDLGLIDDVMASKDAFELFTKGLTSGPTHAKEAKTTMSKETENPGGEGGYTAAQVATAKTDGFGEGQKAAQARIAGIINSDEAKDKGKLAATLAFESEVSVDAAKKILAAASPETQAAAPANDKDKDDKNGKGGNDRFASTMNGDRNPNLGTDGGGGGDDDEAPTRGARLLAAARKVGICAKPATH